MEEHDSSSVLDVCDDIWFSIDGVIGAFVRHFDGSVASNASLQGSDCVG